MIRNNLRWMAAIVLCANLSLATAPLPLMAGQGGRGQDQAASFPTTTPIKHLVVIFQENVSFDHYFGTYPSAANMEGETPWTPVAGTPSVNGFSPALLNSNPNGAESGPVRLSPAQNYTCDQNHDYTPEQQAFDSGLMDKFPEFVSAPCSASTYPLLAPLGAQVVMGYYDGNTVSALWNYAQNYALNDNSYGTNFGPSTPGAVNVVSGMTGNADLKHSIDDGSGDLEADVVNDSIIGDPDPYWDDCGSPDQTSLKGQNIGNLLNAAHISWGWFQGGFAPSAVVNGKAQCNTTTNRLDGTPETAYSAHHNPFEYYQSTANVHHTAPRGVSEIGHAGPANHQYDLSWFMAAASAGNLPAVSYLKANRAQDGHPGNSSPLDEGQFITTIINFLQTLPEWDSTAVVIAWDDSDGWYDHAAGPIVNQSTSVADNLNAPGACGLGTNSLAGLQSRCGYGPRLPLLVVSPYARRNFVDHTITDQSSVVRFIEDNWGLSRIANGSFDVYAGTLNNMFDFSALRSDHVILNPRTGAVSKAPIQ